MKGIAYWTERRNGNGHYLSSDRPRLQLRRLLPGLDGRDVRRVHADESRTTWYDTYPYTESVTQVQRDVVFTVLQPGSFTNVLRLDLPQRQASSQIAGAKRDHNTDWYGEVVSQTEQSCAEGTICQTIPNEPRSSMGSGAVLYLSNTPNAWIFREGQRWLTAPQEPSLDYVRSFWGGLATNQGLALYRRRIFDGAVDLFRTQSDSAFTTTRSNNSAALVTVETFTHDTWGNRIRTAGENLRCVDVTYDGLYAQIPLTETVFSNGCGSGGLTTTVVAFDRGLGVATRVRDPSTYETSAVFDGFGRVTSVCRPEAIGSSTCLQDTAKLAYFLPDSSHPHHSIIYSQSQDGATPMTGDYLRSYAFIDGLGRTVATLKESEVANQWIVSGLTEHNTKGAVAKVYLDHFRTGSPETFDLATQEIRARGQAYDAFGRVMSTYDWDGTLTLENHYHAISVDRWDAGDLDENGPHADTYVTELRDVLGRLIRTTERFKHPDATPDARITEYNYLSNGLPEKIVRKLQSTGATTSRYMVYDRQSRLVLTMEPNSSPGYVLQTSPNLQAQPNQTRYATAVGWRYRYNNAGDLVGYSDPRGCGANFFYDGLGRLKMADYFPCATNHAPYSVPVVPGVTLGAGNQVTSNPGPPTSGAELAYEYDALSSAAVPDGWNTGPLAGRMARSRDQATHTVLAYDDRGRVVQTQTQIAKPGEHAENVLADRYAPHWFVQTQSHDAADRVVRQSTGAEVPNLLNPAGLSEVFTSYNARGSVSQVTSSYDYGATGGTNVLVSSISRTADGLPLAITYGDAAQTSTTSTYYPRPWLESVVTARGALASWPASELDTFQMDLEDTAFGYDLVGNPTTIDDGRDPAAWPAGSKPGNRVMEYDDFNRVKSVTYTYPAQASNEDPWTSPFKNENDAFTSDPTDPQSELDPRRALPTPQVTFNNRVKTQGFAYDWLGNTVETTDDQSGFYDRSLGTITNGALATKPYQLASAATTTGGKTGSLAATYDSAGNMTALYVDRDGQCMPTATCSHVFKYEWDELNRLSRARRWDVTTLNPASPPTVNDADAKVDLRYRYDGDDNRVIKWARDPNPAHAVTDAYTVYVFDSLELRRTQFESGDYVRDTDTEVPYLLANGVRLGRVVYEPNTPSSSPNNQHVFLELGNHLGSTSTVLDKRTGELVEKSTYQAYGGADSDYRPERWDHFREDYRFTGKEEDVEVGIVYFGKRFLNPLLGRWMNPDPLAVHDAGADGVDLNLYAYVEGGVLVAIDPVGLKPIVSIHSGYHNPILGTAKALAGSVGATKVGVHGRDSGLVDQAERAGEPVERVDSLGHAASGFATRKSIFQLNDYLAKRLAPHLTADAKVIVHGCGSIKNREAFVRNLGAGVTLYTHDSKSGPGMPMNWVRSRMETDANGAQRFVSRKLSGDDRVVGEILPESYVKWWTSQQTPSDLKTFLENPKNENFRITNDVRSIMQADLDQRPAGASGAGQEQGPAPQQCQSCSGESE